MGVLHFPDSDHKWAYSAIVDMLNDRLRRLPDDAAFICGFTGLSRKKWSLVRAYLLEHGKLLEIDGYLTNPRWERETAAAQEALEQAREYGRAGGRKSAQQRAEQSGQQSMDLEDRADYQANNRGDKRPDSHPDSAPDHAGKLNGHSLKTNGKIQAPPQPSRGRASASEARDKNNTTNGLSNTTPRAGVDDSANDLLGLTQLCCQAAGLSARVASRPALLTQSMEIVGKWIKAGVDIRETAVPVIESTLMAMSEPAHSLAKFSAAVDTRHAKERQNVKRTGQPLAPPRRPVFEFPDESPEIARFRKSVCDAIKPVNYANWGSDVVFSFADRARDGDRAILHIKGRGKQSAVPILDRHGAVMEKIAQEQLGITNLWPK